MSQLQVASALSHELVSRVIADACTRLPGMVKSEKTVRLDRLIEAGAWSEAALALIELELPEWKLRRLVCEDGQWLCSLSTQPNLPAEIDETADGSDETLPLAILNAFLEAHRRTNAASQIHAPAVPQVRLSTGYAVCCDNFA